MTILMSATDAQFSVIIRRVRYTTQWQMIDGHKCYAAEVTLVNPIPSMSAPDPSLWVNEPYFPSIWSKYFETVRPGFFYRIAPSDEVRTKVWLKYTGDLGVKELGSAKVVVRNARGASVPVVGQTEFDMTGAFAEGPETRDTPEWVRPLLSPLDERLDASFTPVG